MLVLIKTEDESLLSLNSIEKIEIKWNTSSVVAISGEKEYVIKNFNNYDSAKQWFKSFMETLDKYLKQGGILDVEKII